MAAKRIKNSPLREPFFKAALLEKSLKLAHAGPSCQTRAEYFGLNHTIEGNIALGFRLESNFAQTGSTFKRLFSSDSAQMADTRKASGKLQMSNEQ